MRPQVPIDRSRNRPDQKYSVTQQRPSPPQKNVVTSSSQNGAYRRKLEANAMPKSLGGILASNYGVLNEIRDYEQFFGSVNRLDSLSVSSSFDMERAQAGPEHQYGRGARSPLLQEYQRQLRGNPYPMASNDFPKSIDTVTPLEQFPHQTKDFVTPPRTRKYSDREFEKEETKKKENLNHNNGNFLGVDTLPNNALADAVATPNSASENSRPVSAFLEHNKPEATFSNKSRLPPTFSEFNRPPPAFSDYRKADIAPFRCHGVSPSVQPMPSKDSSEQQQSQGGPLQATTMSFLDIFSPANLWKSCSPAIPATESNRAYPYNSRPRRSLEYAEERSQGESGYDSDVIAADLARQQRRQREMIELQQRQRAYEDLMFITWSRPPTPEGRSNGGRSIQRHRDVGTPDTMGSRSRCTPSPASRSLTPEFSIRRSPTSSQIREDLWGSSAYDVPNAVNMAAPKATISETYSIPAPDQAYPQFPASDAIDDFDPFGIGYEPQAKPPRDQPGPADATPRMSNNNNVFHNENHSDSLRRNSSLEPSKRDTKPNRKRSKSTDGTDSELSQTGDDPSSHWYLSTRGDDVVGHTNKISGHYVGNKEGLPNQDQQTPRVQQHALRNYEMLLKLQQGHHQVGSEGTHQDTTLTKTKSSSSSVSRKARKSEVSQLQRRKESEDPSNIYVAYLRFGNNPNELLQLCEHPARQDSKPKNGEVPLKVLASSISTTDCDIRRGEWKSIQLQPYIIPGASLVGVVKGIGQKKRYGFKEGDVVLGLVTMGGNSRYASVCKDLLVKIPTELDPCVAVCLSEIYLAAFQALHMGQRGSLRYRSDSFHGKSVLILGGSSNLGHALIEIALAGGAEYCYALGKERHFEGIRHRGAIPLPKSPDQWLTLIGRQIHILVVVADSNGLYTDDVTPDHFKAVCEDGQVIFIGPPGADPKVAENNTAWGRSSTSSPSPHPSRLICKSIKGSLVERSNFFNLFDSWGFDPKLGRRDLEHLVTLLESGRIRPIVLERVPLSKVARVHSILETMKVPGFIVCAPWIHETSSRQLLGAHALTSSTATSGETFAV